MSERHGTLRRGGWGLPYAPVIVGGRSLHDGADEEGLVAVDLLLTPHDAEPQAARRVAAQDNVLAAVQVPGHTQEVTHTVGLTHRK